MRKQFLYFLIVGSIGFIIDAGGVFILSYLYHDVSPLILRIPPFLLAVTATFYLNLKFTFSNIQIQHIKPALKKYLSTNLMSQGLNWAMYAGLIFFIPFFHDAPWIAVVIGSVSVMFLSFALAKFWVFKR